MANALKRVEIFRNGSNRPATVRVVTEADMTYIFETAPELSDKRIITLIRRLADFEERGDQQKRNRRKPS